MIERKDGETDASWIGRLEAAYKALIPACEKLQGKLEASEAVVRKMDYYWAQRIGANIRRLTGKTFADTPEDGGEADSLLNEHVQAAASSLKLLRAIRDDPGLDMAFQEQIDSLLQSLSQ
jgi:hypothetical protein